MVAKWSQSGREGGGDWIGLPEVIAQAELSPVARQRQDIVVARTVRSEFGLDLIPRKIAITENLST